MNRYGFRGSAVFLVWAGLCAAILFSSDAYLRTVWARELSSALDRAETAAELTEQTLLRTADGLISVLEMVRARTELDARGDDDAAAVIDRRLDDIVAGQRFGVRAASFVERDGTVSWTLRGQPVGTSITDREVYRRVVTEGETFVMSSPVASRTSGYWISLAGQRLEDADGRAAGMAVVAFDPLHLGRLLGTVAGRSGRILLVRHRSNGQIHAASHDPNGRLSRLAVPNHPVVNAARLAPEGRLAYGSPTNGRQVLTAYRHVGADFIAQASFDTNSELLAPYREIARPVLGAAGLFVVGSFIMALAWRRNFQLRRRLEELATLDPLTGLHNRRALEQIFARLLLKPERDLQRFACLLFDIDHFKSINDHFGHAAGDEVLRRVAGLLRAEVRDGDIVCRWGGEELLVLLAGCCHDRAMARAEALRAAIGCLDQGAALRFRPVTASVGVACFPQDGATLAAVVSAADEAMYRAKRGGRNRVAMVEPALAA